MKEFKVSKHVSMIGDERPFLGFIHRDGKVSDVAFVFDTDEFRDKFGDYITPAVNKWADYEYRVGVKYGIILGVVSVGLVVGLHYGYKKYKNRKHNVKDI